MYYCTGRDNFKQMMVDSCMIAQNHDIPVATIEQWIAVSGSNAIYHYSIVIVQVTGFLITGTILYYAVVIGYERVNSSHC